MILRQYHYRYAPDGFALTEILTLKIPLPEKNNT